MPQSATNGDNERKADDWTENRSDSRVFNLAVRIIFHEPQKHIGIILFQKAIEQYWRMENHHKLKYVHELR